MAKGNAVFEVPAEGIVSLDLRFYDSLRGNIVLPLLAPAEARPEPKPLAAPVRNAVLEAGVFGLEKAASSAGRDALPGMTFVTVDLRGRSLLTLASKEGPVATVADWLESRRYIQLVIDGEYAYAPLPESSMPAEPRFLPDVMTGGLLVFCVPEARQSIELRCELPNTTAADEAARHPAPIVLLLEGKRPELPKLGEPIVSIKDDMFEVVVTGQRQENEFAGHGPAKGKTLLVLDVTVSNTGQGGEFFQTAEQLKYTAENAQQSALDEISYLGPHPAMANVWVPGGTRREFPGGLSDPAERSPATAGIRGRPRRADPHAEAVAQRESMRR